MGNIVQYVAEYRHPLSERPFSEVDSLVLSQLSYLRYENIGISTVRGELSVRGANPLMSQEVFTIRAISEKSNAPALFASVHDAGKMKALLSGVADSPRFRDMTLTDFVCLFDEQAETQFAAITFHLGDQTAYVAFRGTDSSLVGWKEDFNMTVMQAVPSQQQGTSYLDAAARKVSGPLRVGGHSKGGNIAVYAAASCALASQQRILAVYSHDGPGFHEDFFSQDGYARIKDRIHKTVPEHSIIGMLLGEQGPCTVIESSRSGIYQHSALSWIIDKDGAFSAGSGIDKRARLVSNSLNRWASGLEPEQRRTLIDAFYKVVRASDAKTLRELTLALATNAPSVAKEVAALPPETKKLLLPVVKTLVSVIGSEIGNILLREDP